MSIQEELRPVYQELQGILSQTPQPSQPMQEAFTDSSTWTQVNGAITEVIKITGNADYERMKIIPQERVGSGFVMIYTFRLKLGSIIDRLHAKYYAEEVRPFSGGPTQVIQQTQSQDQSTEVRVSMLVEMQERITEKLRDDKITPDERSFLEQLKSSVKGAKSVIELIGMVITLASQMGIDLTSLSNLFR